MTNYFIASLFTLSLLFSFVFGLIAAALVFTDVIALEIAVGLTVVIHLLLWLIGPTITDWINRFFYRVEFIPHEKLKQLHPEVAQLIEQISKEYNFPIPKIGIIPDNNPTAFTYGSGRYNARIVLTQGIFHFLNPDEVRAVVAHEMGHVVNRDFIVMMIASTLVQVLYQIYATLIRARGRKSGGAKLIALVSYALYVVGIYLLYYLSRTREYLADTFSAGLVEPRHLSNALIKIAYGIVVAEDSGAAKRLLESTRHMGIIDVKNAKHMGVVSYMTHQDPSALAEAMVFDKVNPWAKWAELSSTHPLTGNRIDHLCDLSKIYGQPFSYDIDSAIERMHVDKSRMYADFLVGVLIQLVPFLFAGLALFLLPVAFVPAAFGIGCLLPIIYAHPAGTPQETTVLDQMRNPYASPVRGQPVAISGQVIGHGVPGHIFGEDMMYQDKTGMIFLDYNSAFGAIGNFFFAVGKLKALFGVPSRATGWFYRGIGSKVTLKQLETTTEKVRSHPILWSLLLPIILVGISAYLYFVKGWT